MTRAILVLEDGRAWSGRAYGAEGSTTGEVVFTTGMTGYQETLTDPSYHRQIVVMTAPHIGNTGVNDEDSESRRIWPSGFVVRDPARRASNWRSQRELVDELRAHGIVGISGVDTRAVTRHVREHGAMRGGVFSGAAADRPEAELVAEVLASPAMIGRHLYSEVTTVEPYVVPAIGEKRFTVAAIDLGIKSMTPHRMAQQGMEVHVLPGDATLDDVLAVSPDGVFVSNAPGDPATATGPIELVREVLRRGLPIFGICFGHQVLGQALGFDTYKLVYGHRGINQPVMDLETGRVEVTAHNHGFALALPGEGSRLPEDEATRESWVGGPPGREGRTVATEFGRVQVSHVCLNDGVIEGLRCLDVPAFSVQYHPEAAAGPHDARYLFARFADLMAEVSSRSSAAAAASAPSAVPSPTSTVKEA